MARKRRGPLKKWGIPERRRSWKRRGPETAGFTLGVWEGDRRREAWTSRAGPAAATKQSFVPPGGIAFVEREWWGLKRPQAGELRDR